MKKLLIILAALTLVIGVSGIAAAATSSADVGDCLTCETDPGNIERGCEGTQTLCYPFDYEDFGACSGGYEMPDSYCTTAKGEIHRALFKICDCITAGAWTGLNVGDTVDVSMEILVDSGSGMESGDNGVYWAENIDSTGIAMQTFSSQEKACEYKNCDPKDAFVGEFEYVCADGTTLGRPFIGPDRGCDSLGDCDEPKKIDRNRVVKIQPVLTQTGDHGYTVTTDDDLSNNSVWWIDIPMMRADPDIVSKGDKVYVKVCLLTTLSGGGVCGECGGCCCTVYIGELCCEDTLSEDMEIVYPYATEMTNPDWWFGMTITNLGGSSGTATITMYENDGDVSTGTVTLPAHSNVVLSASSLAAALTMTTSVEGTMGNSVYYVEVSADVPITGFAMIAKTSTGESMGYLAIPKWRGGGS